MSYDEPKILSSQLNQFCLMGADVGHDRIEECMRIPPAVWVATAEAGQRSGVLHFKLASICMTLANYAAGGWSRRPSIKQAKHGLESVAKVRAAGLFDETQRELG